MPTEPPSPTDPDQRAVDHIRDLRYRLGWSVARLAEEVARIGGSVSAQRIRDVERRSGTRRRGYRVGEVFEVAAALGVAPWTILGTWPGDGDIHLGDRALTDAQMLRVEAGLSTVDDEPVTVDLPNGLPWRHVLLGLDLLHRHAHALTAFGHPDAAAATDRAERHRAHARDWTAGREPLDPAMAAELIAVAVTWESHPDLPDQERLATAVAATIQEDR